MQLPCTRAVFAPKRMKVVATSGSVPAQFVIGGSAPSFATVTARSRLASCAAVSFMRPAVAAPETLTLPLLEIDTVYGRMFPPSRPNAKPRCGEAPAAGTSASSSRTAASRACLLIGRKGSGEPLAWARVRRLILIAFACTALAGCGGGGKSASSGPPAALLHPATLTAKAPRLFTATFKTTKGTFRIEAHRAWAPKGADRFYNLVKSGFYDGVIFFRVVPRFVVQFGISPYPSVSTAWQNATIPDDPPRVHNTAGTVTFAAAGPNTRTTQVFINLGNNSNLDQSGFAPFGAVVSGMDVVDKLYGGYADTPTQQQGEMATQGNAWLKKNYPKLDSITTARVASAPK